MKNNIDFLPEDYLEKKSQRRTNVVCLFLFLLVVAGVGGAFLFTERQQSRLKQKVAEVNQKMVRAGEVLKQLDDLEKKKKEMMEKAAISAMLMEPVPRSLLLATITNDLPDSVSLIDYKMICKVLKDKSKNTRSRNKKARKKKTEAAKPAAPPKTETTIEFTGLAPTDLEVAKLIANLNKSPLFSQVNLKLSEEHKFANEVMRRFQLRVILDPEARASNKDVETARHKHISGM
ncbi:MAG: PilN domain-containing protein [Sedimentisphaerales bacterium]|nr:PilN domain-containing protein [Sedimentisphaerales bacterium]